MAPKRKPAKSRTAREERLENTIQGLQDNLREAKNDIFRLSNKNATLEAIATNSEAISRDLDEARYHGLQSAVATAQLIQRLGTELERCANTGLGLGPVMSASSVEGLSVSFGPIQRLSDKPTYQKERRRS